VNGFNVQVATDAELAANDFKLAGKPPRQLLFLAYAAVAPLLMLAALVGVMRTPGLRWKLAWAIAAFAGVGQLAMNWTTGVLALNPLSLQLLGAGVIRAGDTRFVPWTVLATVPVGAVVVLVALGLRRRRGLRPARS
jgi:hypothetical protein